MLSIPLLIATAVVTQQAQGQGNPAAHYPVFETDKIPAAEHRDRRERLMKEMDPGSVALFFTNPVRNRNNDVDFEYRADSNFLYLTGFEEPDSVLLLAPGGVQLGDRRVREILFVPEADAMSVTWLGYRMGSANVPKLLGIEASIPIRQFGAQIPKLVAAGTAKKLYFAVPPDPSGGMAVNLKAARDYATGNQIEEGKTLGGIVNRMRGIKSPAEIAMIKKAAEISARAHIEAMRSSESGMREWEINALVKYIFAKEGCEYEGYPPICGSGPNSTILHYNTNRGPMSNGDVMCMDTAGEFHGYTADVTRSFPINGKWTKEQRQIYNAVLRAQNLGIGLCKSGNTMQEINRLISEDIGKSLIALGIIKEQSEVRRYYMHGFGHGLGLDVHDPVPSTLAPGAVLTVEPGIYIKEGSPCDKKWWNIGIRIEDDIVVTEGEPLNLSILAPRDPDAIEKLMRESGIGNVKQKPYGG